MRLLIDTQVLIWFLESSQSLPAPTYDSISQWDNDVFISRISLFEIAIKLKAGGRIDLKR